MSEFTVCAMEAVENNRNSVPYMVINLFLYIIGKYQPEFDTAAALTVTHYRGARDAADP